MTLPTEELLQQYFDDRLALTRLDFIGGMGKFADANLTMHELRIVVLVASGAASSQELLENMLNISRDSLGATLEQLLQQGYIRGQGHGNILPTDEAMEVYYAVADRRDSMVEVMTHMDPHDLSALVRGTHALRTAMELDALQESDPTPGDTADLVEHA